MAGARINGFDKPRLPDGDVNETSCRIEEGNIGRACDRPDVGDFARGAAYLDQSSVIAGDIKPTFGMINVETVGAR